MNHLKPFTAIAIALSGSALLAWQLLSPLVLFTWLWTPHAWLVWGLTTAGLALGLISLAKIRHIFNPLDTADYLSALTFCMGWLILLLLSFFVGLPHTFPPAATLNFWLIVAVLLFITPQFLFGWLTALVILHHPAQSKQVMLLFSAGFILAVPLFLYLLPMAGLGNSVLVLVLVLVTAAFLFGLHSDQAVLSTVSLVGMAVLVGWLGRNYATGQTLLLAYPTSYTQQWSWAGVERFGSPQNADGDNLQGFAFAFVPQEARVVGVNINHLAGYAQHNVINLPSPGRDALLSDLAQQTQPVDLILLYPPNYTATNPLQNYALQPAPLLAQEAFATYYQHLSPTGLVAYSTYLNNGDYSEIMRVVATALKSWQAAGVADPRTHVYVMTLNNQEETQPILILVSKTPNLRLDPSLDKDQATNIQKWLTESGFDTLYPSPNQQNPLSNWLDEDDWLIQTDNFPVNLDPLTNNNPFLFHTVRPLFQSTSHPDFAVGYQSSTIANRLLLLSLAGLMGFTLWQLFFSSLGSSHRPGLFFVALWCFITPLVLHPFAHTAEATLGWPGYGYSLTISLAVLGLLLGYSLSYFPFLVDFGPHAQKAWFGILALGVLYPRLLPNVAETALSWPLPWRVLFMALLLMPVMVLWGQVLSQALRYSSPTQLLTSWAAGSTALTAGFLGSTWLILFGGYQFVLWLAFAGLLLLLGWQTAEEI